MSKNTNHKNNTCNVALSETNIATNLQSNTLIE